VPLPLADERDVAGDAAVTECHYLRSAEHRRSAAVVVDDPEEALAVHAGFGETRAVPVAGNGDIACDAAEREDQVSGVDGLIVAGVEEPARSAPSCRAVKSGAIAVSIALAIVSLAVPAFGATG